LQQVQGVGKLLPLLLLGVYSAIVIWKERPIFMNYKTDHSDES